MWLPDLFLQTLLNMQTPVLGLPALYLTDSARRGLGHDRRDEPLLSGVCLWALVQGITGRTLHDIEFIALITPPLEDAEEW